MSRWGGDKIMYLGGSHQADENSCKQASNAEAEPLLRCSYEEADDRIMFYLSHGVKV